MTKNNIAAFDSAILKKELPNNSLFKMAIGAGIVVREGSDFVDAYDKELQTLFDDAGLKRTRKVFCASELSAILGDDLATEEKLLATLFKKIGKHIVDSHFYYTFLPGMTSVSAFGDGPGPYEKIPVISKIKGKSDFFDLIEPSYSMLCAWKYTKDNQNDTILIDNFQGYRSPAWHALWNVRNVYVYYSGDLCNPFISTADLLVRLLKLRILKGRERFNEKYASSLVPELKNNFKIDFLGQRYLHEITPHSRKRIQTAQVLKHPIYFMIRENPKDEDEPAIIRASPIYTKVLDYAYKTNGSVKFYHADDTRIMAKGDMVFTIGERGEKILREMKKLEVPIESLNEKLEK